MRSDIIEYTNRFTALALMNYHKCFFNAERQNILNFKNDTGNERIGRKDERKWEEIFSKKWKDEAGRECYRVIC